MVGFSKKVVGFGLLIILVGGSSVFRKVGFSFFCQLKAITSVVQEWAPELIQNCFVSEFIDIKICNIIYSPGIPT